MKKGRGGGAGGRAYLENELHMWCAQETFMKEEEEALPATSLSKKGCICATKWDVILTSHALVHMDKHGRKKKAYAHGFFNPICD